MSNAGTTNLFSNIKKNSTPEDSSANASKVSLFGALVGALVGWVFVLGSAGACLRLGWEATAYLLKSK